MAVVNPSFIVNGIKGRLRGGVHQYNAGGLIRRANKNTHVTRLSRRNPALQSTPVVAGAWKSLTPTERATWRSTVTPYTSYTRFGVARNTAGYQLFVKNNSRLVNAFRPIITTRPPPVSIAPPTVVSVIASSLPLLQVKLAASLPLGYNLVIAVTPCISPGRVMPIGYWRIILNTDFISGTTVDITTPYIDGYGQLLNGLVVWLKIYYLNYSTGNVSPPVYESAVVVPV